MSLPSRCYCTLGGAFCPNPDPSAPTRRREKRPGQARPWTTIGPAIPSLAGAGGGAGTAGTETPGAMPAAAGVRDIGPVAGSELTATPRCPMTELTGGPRMAPASMLARRKEAGFASRARVATRRRWPEMRRSGRRWAEPAAGVRQPDGARRHRGLRPRGVKMDVPGGPNRGRPRAWRRRERPGGSVLPSVLAPWTCPWVNLALGGVRVPGRCRRPLPACHPMPFLIPFAAPCAPLRPDKESAMRQGPMRRPCVVARNRVAMACLPHLAVPRTRWASAADPSLVDRGARLPGACSEVVQWPSQSRRALTQVARRSPRGKMSVNQVALPRAGRPTSNKLPSK